MNGDQCDLPWLCRGDFNKLLSRYEKRGGFEKFLSGMLQFRAALDFYDLDDLGFMGPNFNRIIREMTKLISRKGLIGFLPITIGRISLKTTAWSIWDLTPLIIDRFCHIPHR
ncbi:hypothetical protein Ddye_025805 [Dipteronia dyeriana]|uniref:Uncharacterized protein n=1 Tax=Dipteronia dyeriana TaxID=168575 RepID=A0AAD9WPY1_9ROSI|nr:hypothetical protein Ddye_025805 [Dipteronia dyeriana]